MAKLYKSYVFRDKDPIIDATRTIVQASKKSYAEIGEASGVSPTTLNNWFQGTTRRPQFCTINAVGRALGHELTWRKRT